MHKRTKSVSPPKPSKHFQSHQCEAVSSYLDKITERINKGKADGVHAAEIRRLQKEHDAASLHFKSMKCKPKDVVSTAQDVSR